MLDALLADPSFVLLGGELGRRGVGGGRNVRLVAKLLDRIPDFLLRWPLHALDCTGVAGVSAGRRSPAPRCGSAGGEGKPFSQAVCSPAEPGRVFAGRAWSPSAPHRAVLPECNAVLTLDEYLRVRERPEGRAAMYQKWRNLTFLHAAVEPGAVQGMLPAGLTVDTFAGPDGRESAWLGLVPFEMLGIRPRSLPSLPWISAFPETNLRTYVHLDGKGPGVWFFSLDAARLLACRIARAWYKLPYWWSGMSVASLGGGVLYRSRRREGPARPSLAIQACPVGEPAPAKPGTLEFFLIERYLLYAAQGARLFTGQVAHPPYEVCRVELPVCDQTFLDLGAGWAHTAFSPGVDVEVFPLRPA